MNVSFLAGALGKSNFELCSVLNNPNFTNIGTNETFKYVSTEWSWPDTSLITNFGSGIKMDQFQFLALDTYIYFKGFVKIGNNIDFSTKANRIITKLPRKCIPAQTIIIPIYGLRDPDSNDSVTDPCPNIDDSAAAQESQDSIVTNANRTAQPTSNAPSNRNIRNENGQTISVGTPSQQSLISNEDALTKQNMENLPKQTNMKMYTARQGTLMITNDTGELILIDPGQGNTAFKSGDLICFDSLHYCIS